MNPPVKITFIFTDRPELAQVPSDERFRSNFEVPDAVKSLLDIQAKIISIGDLIGQFTNANLHVSCPELGLKNHPVKRNVLEVDPRYGLLSSVRTSCVYFEGHFHGIGRTKRSLTIYSPVASPEPEVIYRFTGSWQDSAMLGYVARAEALSDRLLALLNIDTTREVWHFQRFDPVVIPNHLIKRLNTHVRKSIVEERRRTREEEKRKAREAKRAEKLAANPPQPLTHGAGRTVGARPGIYNGVQMRSQLEIRFASELDERGIKWVYEGEALGESGYLVDFYLPALGVWVEVKGRFEPRDRRVLPEVAKYLKTERSHRLLVYTSSGKCFVVNPSGFREVERKNFWGELLR